MKKIVSCVISASRHCIGVPTLTVLLMIAAFTLTLFVSCDTSSGSAGTYTGYVATPTASPSGGTIATGTKITLGCATEGATIYYTYTINGSGYYYDNGSGYYYDSGSRPFPATKYSGPIVINQDSYVYLTAYATKGGITSNYLYASYNVVVPREGIYISAYKFADDVALIKDSVITQTDYSATTMLSSGYTIATDPGTALFYGVHKALSAMKDTDYSALNVDSVNIITFTDGLDSSSSGLSRLRPIEGKTFSTGGEYADYISAQIASRTVAGKPVTAYSIGVKGSDVTDNAGFTSALQKIASPGKSTVLSNFNDVQSAFTQIASGLTIRSETKTDFTMRTGLLNNGEKIRITFDITNANGNPDSSSKYIEGTISASGTGSNTAYTLTNISYSSGNSSNAQTGPLTGTINSTTVSFKFSNIIGYETISGTMTRLWRKPGTGGEWQHDSEYNSAGSTSTTVDKHSAIVFLVLDCSTSLSTSEISSIRTAASSFISSLSSAYRQ